MENTASTSTNTKAGKPGWLIGLIIAGAFVGVIITVAIVGVMTFVQWKNYGVQTENNIKAVWVNNQNILGQYTLKVQEAAQIPEIYKNDLKEVVSAEMQGRYGPNGSQASFQWIQERSNNFDASMLKEVQQIIKAGRTDFQNSQTRLIDIKQTYENQLGYVWSGFWLGLAGYPKIKLDDYKPVLAQDTEQIFKEGKQAPIKLRQ